MNAVRILLTVVVALLAATATAALILGRMPESGDATTVIAIGYATFGVCFLIVTIGKRVERTLEIAMWAMVASILVYLLIVDLFTISWQNWRAVLTGFGNPALTLLSAFGLSATDSHGCVSPSLVVPQDSCLTRSMQVFG